jgi:hypothetical protein
MKKDTSKDEGKQSPSTSDSIQTGKKAIKANKHVTPKPAAEKEKDEKKDAEKWRNEG